MNIIEIKDRQDIIEDNKLHSMYFQFGELIKELRKKALPDSVVESINEDIKDLNSSYFIGNELKKAIKQKQNKVIKLFEKELKIVPKNYYQKHWFAVGMSVLGVPIGFVFGNMIGNVAFFAFGIPVGMAIGIAIGTGMDKKAAEEGRQLDMEIKY